MEKRKTRILYTVYDIRQTEFLFSLFTGDAVMMPHRTSEL